VLDPFIWFFYILRGSLDIAVKGPNTVVLNTNRSKVWSAHSKTNKEKQKILRKKKESLFFLGTLKSFLEYLCLVASFPWEFDIISTEMAEACGLLVDWS
jgi:hypothetical protein